MNLAIFFSDHFKHRTVRKNSVSYQQTQTLTRENQALNKQYRDTPLLMVIDTMVSLVKNGDISLKRVKQATASVCRMKQHLIKEAV